MLYLTFANKGNRKQVQEKANTLKNLPDSNFFGCKFKLFGSICLPSLELQCSLLLATGFCAVVFPNYKLNIVSTKNWFSPLINGLAIEMDYHDFNRSLPLRFVTLTTG